MANRLVEFMQDVIPSIFMDIRYLYPNLKEWKRDLSRLLFQLESRGPALLTDDLPSVAKHLNQCLDQGLFTNPHLVLTRAKRSGEQIPLFMREVFLRIFHSNGAILDEPCPNAVLALKTVFQTWKSIKLPCSKEVIENEVSTFFSTDANLDPPTLGWDHDDLDPSDLVRGSPSSIGLRDGRPRQEDGSYLSGGTYLTEREIQIVERTFDIVASSLGLAPHMFEESRADSYLHPKHGPGVVANLSKGDTKYKFPYWSDKLQRLFPRDYYALPSFGWGFSSDRVDYEYSNEEYPSRVIAVPKTLRKPRLIAAEPVEHQWIQQFLWRNLELRLKTSPLSGSIDFRNQGHNNVLALSSSMDGSYTTMDLSEASDRLTCHTVERFFRANFSWLEALHACRTRRASYDLGPFGVYKQTLKKFAAMGSACTFPVQTLVFCAVGVAAAHMSRNRLPSTRSIRELSRYVRVFGDDIIVAKHCTRETFRVLEYLGLKINKAKTFTGSNFRESCGVDAFRGVNVTPPKMLQIPNGRLGTLDSVLETSNNWFKAGFWQTSNRLLSYLERWIHLLPKGQKPLYPHTILTSCGYQLPSTRRINRDHQVEEVRLLKTNFTQVKHDMSGSQRLLQYFIEEPPADIKWASGTLDSCVSVTRPGWTPILHHPAPTADW